MWYSGDLIESKLNKPMKLNYQITQSWRVKLKKKAKEKKDLSYLGKPNNLLFFLDLHQVFGDAKVFIKEFFASTSRLIHGLCPSLMTPWNCLHLIRVELGILDKSTLLIPISSQLSQLYGFYNWDNHIKRKIKKKYKDQFLKNLTLKYEIEKIFFNK